MNLLVSCMGYDGGKSGISAYMRAVVSRLAHSPIDRLTLIVEEGSEGDFPDVPKIVVKKRWAFGAKGFLWHLCALPFYTRNRAYDVLLILAANRRYALCSQIPTVGVVHDLSQYRVEGKYDPLRMFYLKKIQPLLGRRLNEAVAISGVTKGDIERYWKMPERRITLNYNGWTARAQTDEGVLSKFGLGRYILYVSRIEHPGKNHANLIRAFEALPESARAGVKLVFAGSDWSGAPQVHALAEASPCAKDIVFTGYVSEGEIASLYAHAAAFVFPSFSEGFGLPLVEAMAAGIPSACARGGALEEVGGDAVLTFDPHSVPELSDVLAQLLGDAALGRALTQKGKVRAQRFDWDEHVRVLWTLCRRQYDQNATLQIFNIPFVNARMPEVVAGLDATVRDSRRKTVAFINTHYLNSAYEDKAQRLRLRACDWVLPDGSGVSLACRILGVRYRDNLNGTDLLPAICPMAVKGGYSLFFFGGKDGVAARAADNLQQSFPGLKIAGVRRGYFSPEENDGIVTQINAANPDFLFVGFGVKLQEKWMMENKDKLNARVILAVGGLVDVYSGDLFRIHPWLRERGLEWLGRLYQDPVRLFRRYVIGNPLFLWRVFLSRFRRVD